MKINNHKIWQALTQLTLMCLQSMKGMFSPNVTWHSYFLIPWQSFYRKRAKSLGHFTENKRNRWGNFSPALEMQFIRSLLKYQEIYVQIQTFTDKN